MTLEEIRVKLCDCVTPMGGLNDARVDTLLKHLDDAIAERALPVTREYVEAIAEPVDVAGEEWWLIQVDDRRSLMLSCQNNRWTVWHCIGSAVATVETVGQLLDLLSGLGVRK